jgi:tetratricopeptide (TPR) repeat protein
MKKITVLLLFVLPAITGFSQAKLVNAIRYLENYTKEKDSELIAKAKENIDLYLQSAEIKDPAKAQKVKGQVYQALFENSLAIQTEKLVNVKDANEKTLAAYENTPSTELDEAVKAFAAAKAADTKGIYALDIMNAEKQIYYHYFNKGIAKSNANKLSEAIELYEKAVILDDSNDSTLLNNLASSALYNKDYAKAKTYFNKMIEVKKGSATTYNSLVQAHFMSNDTTGGLAVLKKGREAYPSDERLTNTETQYYVNSGKTAEALKNLNLIIAARPDEANLYVVRGGIYDKLANPSDATGKELGKPADYAEKNKLAEADYKKATDLYEKSYATIASLPKPEAEQLKTAYSQALFNLGVIYFNNGANISKTADKITDNAKFAAENKKANDEFKKALPYFEKSLELNPDQQTMYALKQIYARLEMADKLKAIDAQMRN